jgi:hypothetical protein
LIAPERAGSVAGEGGLAKRRKIMRPTKSTSWFTSFAKWTAKAAGRPATFAGAAGVILVWGLTGPLFGFSDTWQLASNLSE